MKNKIQVMSCGDVDQKILTDLFGRYDMVLNWVNKNESIPGSFWGDSEAGLIANQLLVRRDTPLHSAFHEACHFVCMDQVRRTSLHTDAGGDYDEENGVNYLQILLSDYIPNCGRARMFSDMDAWGYSFRLGSAQIWFEQDAEETRQWLLDYKIINEDGQPTWNVRGE